VKSNAFIAGFIAFCTTLALTWEFGRLPDLHNTLPALTALVSGFSIGVIVYQVFASKAKRLERSLPAKPVTDEERIRAYQELEEAYNEVRALIDRVPKGPPHLDGPHFETAAFLLEEAKAGFERVDSGSSNIESKATSLISIVAGASSALGIFGFSKDGKAVVATPTILAAFTFAVIALICLLYVLRSKHYKDPAIDKYVSAGMVAEDNRVGIALSLAKAYRESRDVLAQTIRYEPLALFIGYVSIATAAGLVLINAATARVDMAATVRPKTAATASGKGRAMPAPTRPKLTHSSPRLPRPARTPAP